MVHAQSHRSSKVRHRHMATSTAQAAPFALECLEGGLRRSLLWFLFARLFGGWCWLATSFGTLLCCLLVQKPAASTSSQLW